MNETPSTSVRDALLERIKEQDRARLRVYIGAAPGVGKTYEMLQEAHALASPRPRRRRRLRRDLRPADTEAQLQDLEVVPRRPHRVSGRDDARRWTWTRSSRAGRRSAWSTNSRTPMCREAETPSDTRMSLEILDAGIHVMTAVNIQHLETLNDAVARVTGVRVRETVPDTFLDRADEVINVDVTSRSCATGCGRERSTGRRRSSRRSTNFFRKGNLSTLRELALRAVADEVGEKAASYRAREGLEPAHIPERVMVCMSSNALAPRVIRTGARIAGRLGSRWYAVYVETPREKPDRIKPERRRCAAAEHPARREPRRDSRAGARPSGRPTG